jgi:mannose-1-phosphate guanylyltransferase
MKTGGEIVSRQWAVILAGGDGVRLRPLTRRIAGDERPKQFCPLVAADTLLTETRRRAALSVPSHRTLIVVNRAHERFYAPQLADVHTRALVAQPENRGTAPAVLYALLTLAKRQATGDTVTFLPSDHFVSDDALFMRHVAAASEGVARRPDLVTLLGVKPDRAESGYGWIEPGAAVAGTTLQGVRGFCEKPVPAEADLLRARGWLWNTFVMVGRVATLITLIRVSAPDLWRSFSAVSSTLGTIGETATLERLYCGLPSLDFSRQVLTARPDRLAVLPVCGVHWSDLGDPARVLTTRRLLLESSKNQPMPAPISESVRA